MGSNTPPRSPQRAKRTRSRTGCWTCREAGYKCDEIKPECGRCTRLSIHCKGYGLRLKWQSTQAAGGRRRSTGNQSPPPNPAQRLSLRPSDMTLEQYRLLHHWTVYTSPLLCISDVDQANPFQMYLTPMSMCDGSRPLRHAVLSIAASHLTVQEVVAPTSHNYALMAQNYRITAIASLRETLSQGLTNDATLATILLLEISKQFDNTSLQYEGDVNHLIGAKELILARGGPQSLASPCARFLLNQLLYHDLLSAVSRGSEPLIRQYWPSLENAPFIQLDLQSSRGYHQTILQAVARISELKARKELAFAPGQDATLADFTLAGEEVETELKSMAIPEPGATASAQSYTTEAHRSAALIYLYRVIYDIGAPHPLTLSQVRRCIDSMASVPVSSPLLSAHVWPLFTAGCEATEPSDREFVKQRLMDMYRQRRIHSLRKVCELMERVWLSKDYKRSVEGAEEMSRVGCIEVVRGLGEMLYLV
ncbi:fungal-specific transcription factor domain-containing protein [Aspergillus carlsbadensis]|nr:fungal-specific transcription factor domain-containing protein [Aspergillus carlsbadensis]